MGLRPSHRQGHAEPPADPADGSPLDGREARNGGLCAARRVHPHVVTPTVVVKETRVLAEVLLERAAIRRNRRARDTLRARRASRAMRNAPSMSSASVMSSGSMGLVTTNPPSSAVVNVSNRRPSDTV